MTYTVVTLEVSQRTYDEVYGLLKAQPDYQHVFMSEGGIDMTHIAIVPPEGGNTEPDAHCITTADGGCISTDPRCMHQPRDEDMVDIELRLPKAQADLFKALGNEAVVKLLEHGAKVQYPPLGSENPDPSVQG